MELINFNTVGIIGYGKFSKLLLELFAKHFPELIVKVYSRSHEKDKTTFFSYKEVTTCDLVIPCVPIRNFKDTIKEISKHITPYQTLLDICSVKVYPKEIMLQELPKTMNIVSSHPMFGPSSYRKLQGQLTNCCTVLENVSAKQELYNSIKIIFESFGSKIVEISAEEHDKRAAKFQFITLLTGNILKHLNITRDEIDTPSAEKMLDFIDMVSDDYELIKDIYKYNPYCKPQLQQLEKTYINLISSLKL